LARGDHRPLLAGQTLGVRSGQLSREVRLVDVGRHDLVCDADHAEQLTPTRR
jgi:hypothetical protein